MEGLKSRMDSGARSESHLYDNLLFYIDILKYILIYTHISIHNRIW